MKLKVKKEKEKTDESRGIKEEQSLLSCILRQAWHKSGKSHATILFYEKVVNTNLTFSSPLLIYCSLGNYRCFALNFRFLVLRLFLLFYFIILYQFYSDTSPSYVFFKHICNIGSFFISSYCMRIAYLRKITKVSLNYRLMPLLLFTSEVLGSISILNILF